VRGFVKTDNKRRERENETKGGKKQFEREKKKRAHALKKRGKKEAKYKINKKVVCTCTQVWL
jgi:hypothetical protein